MFLIHKHPMKPKRKGYNNNNMLHNGQQQQQQQQHHQQPCWIRRRTKTNTFIIVHVVTIMLQFVQILLILVLFLVPSTATAYVNNKLQQQGRSASSFLYHHQRSLLSSSSSSSYFSKNQHHPWVGSPLKSQQQKQMQQQQQKLYALSIQQEKDQSSLIDLNGVANTVLATSTTPTITTSVPISSTSSVSAVTSSVYGADQITVLEGLDPVRKRPGMYIGSTGPDGLHHLIWEVVDNSVDEALAGHANVVTITLNMDGSVTITDDGRGIPTDLHPVTGKSALETVLTVLHAGGKFNNQQSDSGYRVSGGLHGVGISVVNALSEYVIVTVRRQTKEYTMRFERGIPTSNGLQIVDIMNENNDNDDTDHDINEQMNHLVERLDSETDHEIKKEIQQQIQKVTKIQTINKLRTSGTSVTFKPDILVFKGDNGNSNIDFDPNKLMNRLDEIAFLNAGLLLTLQDNRFQKKSNNKNTQLEQQSTMSTTKTTTMKHDAATTPTDATTTESVTSTPTTTTTTVPAAIVPPLSSSLQVFYHAGGLAEYIELLCRSKTPLLQPSSSSSNGGSSNTKTKKRATNRKNMKTPIIDNNNNDNTDTNDNKGTSSFSLDATSGLLSEDGTTILCSGTIATSSESNNNNNNHMVPRTPPVTISIALRWSSDMYTETILSFCNNIRTKDGGSHVEGLRSCLTRTVNQFAKKTGKMKEGSSTLPGECIREGLTAVISVSVSEPEFEGQTKGRLGNPEVRPAVDTLLSTELTKLFEWRPDIFDSIYTKATEAQTAALAAKAAREMVRRKTLLTSTVLPGKLADCATKNPMEAEIFIVEGDSAAGSAKQGRDRRTQAILPLRGKILNVEKVETSRIYQNQELQGLISALGLGVKGAPFDVSTLRYHSIVIMTDADVDGAHIRVLLLTFLYRYQRELLENGHVYIAQPPLYKLSTGSGRARREEYAFDDTKKDIIIRSMLGEKNGTKTVTESDMNEALASGKIILQRFKGLGEMMPEQLWSTTMDPKRRRMVQVTVNDAALADQTLSMLMGDAVTPRKNFISTSAEYINFDLDI